MFFARSKLDRFSARWLAVGLALSLSLAPGAVRAEDPGIVASVKSYLGQALKAASAYLESEPAPEAAKADPDEIARRAELDQLVRSIFLAEKGYHFTQSRWGAQPVPYQIEGLTTVELPGGAPNSADYKAGIDRRVTYEFEAKSFRTYTDLEGWGKWQKGKPPHLEGVTLVRQNGMWKVSVSPSSAYALR